MPILRSEEAIYRIQGVLWRLEPSEFVDLESPIVGRWNCARM